MSELNEKYRAISGDTQTNIEALSESKEHKTAILNSVLNRIPGGSASVYYADDVDEITTALAGVNTYVIKDYKDFKTNHPDGYYFETDCELNTTVDKIRDKDENVYVETYQQIMEYFNTDDKQFHVVTYTRTFTPGEPSTLEVTDEEGTWWESWQFNPVEDIKVDFEDALVLLKNSDLETLPASNKLAIRKILAPGETPKYIFGDRYHNPYVYVSAIDGHVAQLGTKAEYDKMIEDTVAATKLAAGVTD